MRSISKKKQKWTDFYLGDKVSSEALETTKCPICGTDKSSKLFFKYYRRLVKCQKCHLIYTNPRIKKEYIKKLYSSHYFKNNQSSVVGYKNYQADETKIRLTFKRRILEIMKNIKTGKLLDLGCAMGFFVDESQKLGWQADGIEISDYAVKYSQTQLHLNIKQGDIQDVHLENNRYDLITMWDVIEHLSDPKDVLNKINKALNKDGVLVFSTPDIGSIPAKVSGHHWIGYKLSDEHLTYFSLETLKLLCEKTGFKIIKTRHIGKYVSFSLFAERLGDYSKGLGKIAQMVNFLIPKSLKFYLNPLDIICVNAKKI